MKEIKLFFHLGNNYINKMFSVLSRHKFRYELPYSKVKNYVFYYFIILITAPFYPFINIIRIVIAFYFFFL